MGITLFGITNCDSVAKSRKWLESRGISYAFHDYKKAGITAERLSAWIASAGLDKVLNKSGTTFKKLPDATRAMLDESLAIALMVEQPSMIKRPILERDDQLLFVGFKASEWEKLA